mgnify:CR=1 FL=1
MAPVFHHPVQTDVDPSSRAMRDRTDAAAAYLSAHPDVICIVSGGQGPGEKITEAACMRRLLLDAGIPGTRIWLEPKASDTAENLANSLALIEAQTGTRPDRLGIVSSEYHLRRAQLVASRQGCQGVAIAAPTSLVFMQVNYFIREAFGLWYYWLFK